MQTIGAVGFILLVLKASNPYVADLTVKDSHGNMAMGSLPVTLYYANNNPITTATLENGTAQITLPKYYASVTATVGGDDFYLGSTGTGAVQYDLGGMIQTQGPAGSVANGSVANAKFTIIKAYIQHSGAFTYDPVTGNYTWSGNEGCDKWTDTADRGYCVVSVSPISMQELNSSTFDNQYFTIAHFWMDGNGNQQSEYIGLTKMEFFTFLLGEKLYPSANYVNPLDWWQYTGLTDLASDFATLLSEPQSYFQTDSGAKNFSAKVQGELTLKTRLGFPKTKSLLDQLVNFFNSIIDSFINAITAVWNALVSFVGAVVNFIMAVWNNIIGPALGAVIELVKSVVNVLISTTVNLLVQPIISTDLLNRNPTDLHPLNSTEITQVKSDYSTYKDTSALGFQDNLNLIQSSPISLIPTLPISLNGPIGDLIQMSGPMIIQTIIEYVMSAILKDVFISIFHIDTISISNDNINNFLTSLLGMSVTEFENTYSINSNSLVNDPTSVMNEINSIISNMDLSVLDFSDSNSWINRIGIGFIMKGMFNIEEILINAFSSILPSSVGGSSSTNIQTSSSTTSNSLSFQTTSTQTLSDLKIQAQTDYFKFIVSDWMKQGCEFALNRNDENQYTSAYFTYGASILKFTASVALLYFGTNVKRDIDIIKGENILAVLSDVEGSFEFWSDLYVSIGDLLSTINNPVAYVFYLIGFDMKFVFSLFVGFSAFADMGQESTFGAGYDFFNAIDGILTFIWSIKSAITIIHDEFNIFDKFLNVVESFSKYINVIPGIIALFDIGKLITGLCFINDL